MRRLWKVQIVVAMIVVHFGGATQARGEDAFYRVSLEQLIKPAGGKLYEPEADRNWNTKGSLMAPRVCRDAVADGGSAEAYMSYPQGGWTVEGFRYPGSRIVPARKWEDVGVVFRAPAGKEISGRLMLPAEDWRSSVAVRFTVPATASNRESRAAFYRAKADHYEALLGRGIPGAAWFRHEADAAHRALGDADKERNLLLSQRRGEIEESYALFSGGRALSENLQLDRALLQRQGEAKDLVPIDSLKGITVAEMDWKPLIAGKQPATDALAEA